jgi:hypothetical protein
VLLGMVMSINTTKQHNMRFKSNAIIGIAFTSLFGVINGLVFHQVYYKPIFHQVI